MITSAKNAATKAFNYCYQAAEISCEFVKERGPDLTPYTQKINSAFQTYFNKTLDQACILSRKVEDYTGVDKFLAKRAIVIVPAFIATSATLAMGGLAGLALRVGLVYMVSQFEWSYSSNNVDDKERNNPHWFLKNDLRFAVSGQLLVRGGYHVITSIFSLNLYDALLKAATVAYVIYQDKK